MNLIHVTDSHFRTNTPINRTDDILESLFEKFEFVLDYTANKNAKLLHTGDLFHTPSVPDFVATRLVRLFKKYGVEVYFIIGNHDVVGHNCSKYDYSKIGLMSEYPWFHLLAKKPVINKKYILCGYDFTSKMECEHFISPIQDFNLPATDSRPIICCTHQMLTDDTSITDGNGKFKTLNWQAVNTTASILLTGHYHPGFGIKKNVFDTYIVNPGAMIRQEASKIDMERKIMISKISVSEGDFEVTLKNVPYKKDVFDLDNLYLNLQKEDLLRFGEALSQMKDEDMFSSNAINSLETLYIKKEISESVFKKCKSKIESMGE